MNIWDIVIIAAIAACVILAVLCIIRNKKKGGGCHGSCDGCSMYSGYSKKDESD